MLSIINKCSGNKIVPKFLKNDQSNIKTGGKVGYTVVDAAITGLALSVITVLGLAILLSTSRKLADGFAKAMKIPLKDVYIKLLPLAGAAGGATGFLTHLAVASVVAALKSCKKSCDECREKRNLKNEEKSKEDQENWEKKNNKLQDSFKKFDDILGKEEIYQKPIFEKKLNFFQKLKSKFTPKKPDKTKVEEKKIEKKNKNDNDKKKLERIMSKYILSSDNTQPPLE